GESALASLLQRLHPVSLLALLVMLVLLFGFQGGRILTQPLIIAILAIPILVQVYFNAGLAYWLNRRFGVAHCVAGPSALIGASNFFELAVATAVAVFGVHSGAALATVVGVLVEVPVMLSAVRMVTDSKPWYEARCRGTRPLGNPPVPAYSEPYGSVSSPPRRHLRRRFRRHPARGAGAARQRRRLDQGAGPALR